jgi:hypothetical protein
MPELHQTNGEPVNLNVRYEKTDVNVRGILWFVVGLGGLGLLVHFVIGGTFSALKGRQERDKPPLPEPIARERRQLTRDMIPPLSRDPQRVKQEAVPPFRRFVEEGKQWVDPALLPLPENKNGRKATGMDNNQDWQPRLETSELEDRESLQAAERKYLTSFGVVNRKKGVYRIPIDRAIQLLADPKVARANGIRVRALKKDGEGR